MATHDYVIDNSTGANVRADINSALQAILTNNSSASAPGTTAAYMWWADTTSGILKIRNSTNNGWVELLQLDGTLTLEDGTATNPALAFRDDLNTGVYSSAPDTFNVATAGVERMELGATTIFNEDGADVDFRIEGDNNANLFYLDAGNDRIAIGTNSPQNNLHLHQADSGKCILQFTNTTTGTGATDGLHVGHVADEDVAFWNHEDTDINIATNNTHRIKIKNDGLVGINLGSGVDPLALVHMKGDLYITTNSSTANEGNAIKFQTKTSGFDTSYGAAIHGLRVGNSSSYLRFDSGGQTEKMRLDENGILGIGLTPSSGQGILQLNGGLRIAGSAAADDTSGPYIFRSSGADNMNFATGSNQRMIILSTGNIGIGSTNPGSKLSIEGTANNTNSEFKVTASGVASGYLGCNSDGLNIGTDTAGLKFKTGVTGGGSVGNTGSTRMRVDSVGDTIIFAVNVYEGGRSLDINSNTSWSTFFTFSNNQANAFVARFTATENNNTTGYLVVGSVVGNQITQSFMTETNHAHSKDVLFQLAGTGNTQLQVKANQFTTTRRVRLIDVFVSAGRPTYA